MKTKLSYKELISEKAFMRLIVANAINRFGDSISLITFQWIVFLVTGSPFWIAIVAGVNFLPNILFQPFFAVLVERMNKKKIMVICDFGRAAIILALIILHYFDSVTPAVLLIFAFTNSTFESFRLPAGISLRPQILQKEKFTHGIAMDSSISRISELVGYGIAGALIAITPLLALLIDFLSFFTSATTVSSIPHEEVIAKENKLTVKKYFADFSDGFKYFKLNKTVFYLAIFGAAMNLSASPIMSFQTAYVADYLLLGAFGLSFINISATLGKSFGAFIAPKIRQLMRPSYVFILGGVEVTLLYITLAILPSVGLGTIILTIILTGIMFFDGTVSGIVGVVYSSVFYVSINDAYISRIVGIFSAMSTATIPLGSFAFAFIASKVSIPIIFVIGAIISIIIYVGFSLPQVIRNISVTR